MSLARIFTLVVGVVLFHSCKKEFSTGIRDVVTDPPVDVTTPFVLPSTLTFDLKQTGKDKNGMIGFLGSVTTAAPADALVLPLKPLLWRTGRQGDAFAMYSRFNNWGVKRQLLLLSDFRNIAPTQAIFEQYGYGALADSLSRRANNLGYHFEWDLFNEPNDSLKNDFNGFMTRYWNTSYNAIRKNIPGAIIHGPSTTINNSGNFKADSMLVYQFIDAAIAANTLPDYINWHFQIGYNIAEWHNSYKNSILSYIQSKGKTVKGVFVGETIRPGNERNTSPGVLVDVIAATEVYEIPQVRASWTSQTIYGVGTYPVPVLGGLFNNTDGTGPRGIWWAHEFYAKMSGKRIVCVNKPTGNDSLVAVAFRDDAAKRITAMVAPRDEINAAIYASLKSRGASVLIANMNEVPGLVVNGKVRVKIWRNLQTQAAVSGYGTSSLPLILDKDITVDKNKLNIPFIVSGRWEALLIEITAPAS